MSGEVEATRGPFIIKDLRNGGFEVWTEDYCGWPEKFCGRFLSFEEAMSYCRGEMP